jgi:putative ABC transport system permease protein
MDNWLQDFAFRTDITAVPFITTGVVALAVAIMTVGIQSLRAALKNPINALRKE